MYADSVGSELAHERRLSTQRRAIPYHASLGRHQPNREGLLSQAEMRMSAASRSVDSQRIKSPPVPSTDRELVGILRPARLIAAILRRSEPIVVLSGAAGMGKSTLLRIFSMNKGARLYTELRHPHPPNRGVIAL